MLKYMVGDCMKNEFINLVKTLGVEINDHQYRQFEKYFEILVEWNEKINLTAITDEQGVFVKHFYDSLCLVKSQDFTNQTLLDVGSGAGFPSIPLKIIFPDLRVTIIDALSKRIKFLELLTKELGVDVELIHGRAEEYKRKHCFDIVTGRAVANMRMLAELCIPFVKVDGVFLAMKGSKSTIELNESADAIKTLGGKVEEDINYLVDEQERHILVIKKEFKTSPKYPRRFSKIKSNPL